MVQFLKIYDKIVRIFIVIESGVPIYNYLEIWLKVTFKIIKNSKII